MAIGWAILLHFCFEIALGVIGLLGTSAVFFQNATLGVTLQAVAVGVALLFWILLACGVTGGWSRSCCFGGNVNSRLDNIVGARILYALASLVLHGFSLFAWILYANKFAGIGAISTTVNLDAYIARANLHVLQSTVFFAMFGILVFDMRRNKKVASPAQAV
jgi:hypothetical protein